MKKIFPCSILTIILEIFFLAICGWSIAGFIYGIQLFNLKGFLCSLCSAVLLIGSFVSFLSFVKKAITITYKELYVNDDIADKKNLFLRKIQNKTSVMFDEINKIYIETSIKDSQGQSIKHVFVPMPYLVFICKDEQKKMINVYNYSKKQVAYLIDEIKNRALLLGNDLKIDSGKEIVSKFIQEAKFKD